MVSTGWLGGAPGGGCIGGAGGIGGGGDGPRKAKRCTTGVLNDSTVTPRAVEREEGAKPSMMAAAASAASGSRE